MSRLRSWERRRYGRRGGPNSHREDEPRTAAFAHHPAMRRTRAHSNRRSGAWLPAPGSPPDVGLVVAAATAPGTFAQSLSPRSALDQGLVTGLATGLHFLLSVGAQDALVATSRVLVGGARRSEEHTSELQSRQY